MTEEQLKRAAEIHREIGRAEGAMRCACYQPSELSVKDFINNRLGEIPLDVRNELCNAIQRHLIEHTSNALARLKEEAEKL